MSFLFCCACCCPGYMMSCCWFCCCCKGRSQFKSTKLPTEIEGPMRYPILPDRSAPPPPKGTLEPAPQKEIPDDYETFGAVKKLALDFTDESNVYCNKDVWLNPYNAEEFVTYLDQQLRGRNVGLVREFNSLAPLKFRSPSDEAKSMNNRKKNVDANFIPYDMSRVVLKNETNYINASVIPGYHREMSYVVAQTPIVSAKVSTLGSFWEMVWQEDIRCMVSLTSDMGQGDPEKGAYWPKDKKSEQTFADSISVRLTQKTVYELTTHRTFIVSLEENRKKSFLLHQIEFSSRLIDQKSPAIVSVLLTLVQQIGCVVDNMGDKAKLCFVAKWGNSLIGILLAVYDISKAIADKSPFSVYQTMDSLLNHRSGLVTEYHHYKLIYILILELMQELKPISWEDLKQLTVGKIDPESEESNAVTVEYDKVDFFCNKAYFMKSHTVADLNPRDQITNSFPWDENRVCLMNSPTQTDYINASYVHMESGSAPIITAVHPTKGTVREFFWMLMSCDVHVVFVLAKSEEIELMSEGIIKSLSYWSPLNQEMSYGEFTVLRSRPQEVKGMEMFQVLLSYKPPKMEKRQHKFQLYLYKQWDRNDLPTDSKGCLEVLQFIEEFRGGPEGHRPVVIQSIDGSTKVGVMIATLNGISQMKKGEELDLPWVVKNLRNQRMHLISCREEYQKCYQLLIEFSTLHPRNAS